jgi:CheY-like chemotaxis protein
MKDEFITLRMLMVSGVAQDRALIRRAAIEAAVPIRVEEIDAAADAEAACAALARDAFDAVLFDSRMPKAERQKLIDAAQAAGGRPLTVLIGAAELKTREVLTDGLEVNGVLAKPIEQAELQALIGNCVRARLPSRVLIVDDSSTMRSVIRKVLQASRFRLEAEEVAEGQAAIERAKKENFDIFFLDCHMPGLDGFATLSELKRARPQSKVVMITGTRDPRTEARARADGAADFLYKPFYAKDIDAALNRVFGLLRARWN